MPARRPRKKFGPLRKERIFFACLPDAETAGQIHRLAEKLKHANGLEGALILPEHLHVTLFHLGDWPSLPEEIVRIAEEAAQRVAIPAFNVAFRRVESFRNRTGVYPFVLVGEALDWKTLRDALALALKHAGLGGATKGEFAPHVTLTYDAVRAKHVPVEPVSWSVRDFVLIHSLLGKTAHVHLGRWPLKEG